MALVDYSSSGSCESVDEEPPAKKAKGSVNRGAEDGRGAVKKRSGNEQDGGKPLQDSQDGPAQSAPGASDMPPLPSSFHDLYASNVRQSTTDVPSLHQGRKRQTPHIVGNWPSHVYVEWYPEHRQHDILTQLLKEVEAELQGQVQLHQSLTSDLGAPLPLHISLSRPLSLATADKDRFYERLSSSIQSSGIGCFSVVPRGLAWYKSPDSDRTFLIMRVTAHDSSANDMTAPNPELLALLRRSNTTAALFHQKPLYQQTHSEQVGSAFHISVGWSFGIPSDETSLRSLKVFKTKRFAEVRDWKVDVSAVKVKIGNVVHHVPLEDKGAAGNASFER